MDDNYIKINIKAIDGLTGEQLSAFEESINRYMPTPKPEPTESAKRLKDAVKKAEYDQCANCGERNFERVVNKVIVTSGYYFKAGKLKERPPRDDKGIHKRNTILRCSECKTIYNQKERKEGL